VIAVQWQNLTHRHWCIIINSSDKTLSAACHSAGLVEIEIHHWHYTDFRYVQHSAETGTTVHRTWPHLSYTYISSDDLNWWQIILASVVQFKLRYLFTSIVDFFYNIPFSDRKVIQPVTKNPWQLSSTAVSIQLQEEIHRCKQKPSFLWKMGNKMAFKH